VPGWQRTYVIACAAAIGYCVAYLLCDFGQWPRLFYFPYEGEWGWYRSPPGSVPMAYVGMLLWGLIGATVAAGIAWILCRFTRRELSDRVLKLCGGWVLSCFALVGLYFTWNLWPF